MTQYFRKPEIVTAVQYLGEKSVAALTELCGPNFDYDKCDPAYCGEFDSCGGESAAVLESKHHAWVPVYEGDWVLKHQGGPFNLEVMDNMDFVRDYVKAKAVLGD